ncbi:MAG: addiction module protein [bacterium]|nr:addiction module protein [bacterium]
MNALAERLAEDALTLPDDDRAALVDVLLRSLKSPAAEEIDRLWAEEAERRVKEIEDGTVELLDGREVLREVRERLRR